MAGTLLFEIPNKQKVMTQLVEVMPRSWSWIDGALKASHPLIASGIAIEDTVLSLSRFHPHPILEGRHEDGKIMRPDIFGVLLEKKRPGIVSFDEAGYKASGVEDIDFDLAKRFAIAFIKEGYRGRLSFFSGCRNNHKFDNPEDCSIILFDWHGKWGSEELGYQPPRIRINWDERHGGQEKNIAPIAERCRSLGLREYKLFASRY